MPARACSDARVRLGWWLGVAATVALLIAPLAGEARTARRTSSEVVSGAPEIKRTSNGELKRWQQQSITIYLDASLDALGPDARQAVIAGFDAWQAADTELPEMAFEACEGATAAVRQDGRNTVSLGPIDIAGHQTDLAVTISHVDTLTGEILEADVVINAAKVFMLVEGGPEDALLRFQDPSVEEAGGGEVASCSMYGREGTRCGHAHDLQNLVAHEAGHFLGLGEDRDDSLATMYNCSSYCETHKRSIAESDAAALVEVYADGFDDEPGIRCSIGSVAARPGGGHAGWAALGWLGWLAVARRRALRSR